MYLWFWFQNRHCTDVLIPKANILLLKNVNLIFFSMIYRCSKEFAVEAIFHGLTIQLLFALKELFC